MAKALKEMKLGIHTDFTRGANKALEEGAKALGMEAVFRAVNVYRQGETEAFDAVACGSMHGNNTQIVADYMGKGIPCLVHDLCRVRRDLQQIYLGIGGLHWMPKGPCPSDRAERLGISVKERKGDGKFHLILGQMPGDKAHGHDEKGLEATYSRWAALIKATSDLPVVFRAHPNHTNLKVAGVDEVRDPSLESLDEVLQDAVACYALSSTAGVRAIEMGVPLYCSPSAFYAGVADGHMVDDQIIQLDGGDKDQFLADLAYTQWSLRELANGTALRFLLIELGLFTDEQLPKLEAADEADAKQAPEEKGTDADPANDPQAAGTPGADPEPPGGGLPGGFGPDEHHKSLIGSSVQPSEFALVGGETLSLGDVVAKAHAESGLTVDQWNDQQDDEREARIKAVVDGLDLLAPGEEVDAAAAEGDAAQADGAEDPAAGEPGAPEPSADEIGEALEKGDAIPADDATAQAVADADAEADATGEEKPAEEPAGEAKAPAQEESAKDEPKPGKPKGGKGSKKAAK